MNPKTIFITCFFNLVVRNILETECFSILKSKKDIRIVLLVPEKKGDFFRKEFGGANVIVEEIPFLSPSKINLFFHFLSWNLLNNDSKKIHRIVQLGKDKNRLRYWFTSFLSLLGVLVLIRKIFRALDYWFVPGGGYDDLFEKYKPSVVFATDMQDLRTQEYSDTYLIREARRLGIPSVGMSRSWDSMTTKGLLRTIPDLLIVQNKAIANWAIQYHSVSKKRIVTVGIPHYDQYLSGKRLSRESVFSKLGLNPGKKLVFVTPPSDIWTGEPGFNNYLLKALSELGEQIVVRFPIFGKLEIGDFVRPRGMVFDIPSNESRLEESLLRRSDDDHLADLLFQSDLVVTSPSSIILDAAVFGKPTILIGFDGDRPLSYWKSLRRYYDYEHQQAVIQKGNLVIAKSREELLEFIRKYLDNPAAYAKNQLEVAEEFCYRLDGHSGERLAETLLNLLNSEIRD